MKSRTWSIGFLALFLLLLAVLGSVTVVIDPFFHYHAPLESLQYPITEERYQNDGIVTNFSYDAVITGTSMTENFMASEFDRLFSCDSVKVPLSGSFFKETRDLLDRAFRANPDIKYVVRSVDGMPYYLLTEKDTRRTDAVFPDYLYNDCPLDDVSYVFNKEVLFLRCSKVLVHTLLGYQTTDFDACYRWMGSSPYGRDAVMSAYSRPARAAAETGLSDADRALMEANLRQNFLTLAEEHPQTDFYLFFPPYSILWFDEQRQLGKLEQALEVYEYAAELLLSCDNIHLFTFFDDFDLVCDLDRYTNYVHYNADVNSEILLRMREGRNQLTPENCREVFSSIRAFYTAYDYEALFAA